MIVPSPTYSVTVSYLAEEPDSVQESLQHRTIVCADRDMAEMVADALVLLDRVVHASVLVEGGEE